MCPFGTRPGAWFKILAIIAILGMIASGFCFGSCLVLVGWTRIPEFFHAPVGFKGTPLEGISAAANSVLLPSLAALAAFWLFFWALTHFIQRHTDWSRGVSTHTKKTVA